MAKNRTIPYGYHIEMGRLEPHKDEKEVVIKIYTEYAQGKSYKTIAELLTYLQVPYNEDRTDWNKNVVARILQNERYLGNEKYPAIVSEELKNKSVMAKKKYTHTESKVLKQIKPYLRCDECGEQLKRRQVRTGERWYCENSKEHISTKLSDEIIENEVLSFMQNELNGYNLIQSLSDVYTEEVKALQENIERQLNNCEIEPDSLQNQIIRLAELKYLLLKDTMHLKAGVIRNLNKEPITHLHRLGEVVVSINVIDDIVKSVTMVDGVKVE